MICCIASPMNCWTCVMTFFILKSLFFLFPFFSWLHSPCEIRYAANLELSMTFAVCKYRRWRKYFCSFAKHREEKTTTTKKEDYLNLRSDKIQDNSIEIYWNGEELGRVQIRNTKRGIFKFFTNLRRECFFPLVFSFLETLCENTENKFHSSLSTVAGCRLPLNSRMSRPKWKIHNFTC